MGCSVNKLSLKVHCKSSSNLNYFGRDQDRYICVNIIRMAHLTILGNLYYMLNL